MSGLTYRLKVQSTLLNLLQISSKTFPLIVSIGIFLHCHFKKWLQLIHLLDWSGSNQLRSGLTARTAAFSVIDRDYDRGL
jgi:hypothetical protein